MSPYLDEFKFRMLAERIDSLGDSEHGADYVVRRVAQVPNRKAGFSIIR